MWYAAHAVLAIRFVEGAQTEWPIWENVYLIEADDDETAMQKAETRAIQDAGDSNGTMRWRERRARFEFKGIRKLITCTDGNRDGSELTFSEFVLASEEDVCHAAAGDEVVARYVE